MKKYELTNETIEVNNVKLYRIRALKDFFNIKLGELGGFVQSEKNLSHNDNCWVYDDSQVFDNARIYDNAIVYGNNSQIFGNALLHGNMKVFNKKIEYALVPLY